MHFGHFRSVDRFEPAKCIFCYRFPTAPKLWTDSNHHTPSDAFQKSFSFKIYLQSRRCKGILDRFELPHSVLCQEQGQSEKDAFSVWITYFISLLKNFFMYNKRSTPKIGKIAAISIPTLNPTCSGDKDKLFPKVCAHSVAEILSTIIPIV